MRMVLPLLFLLALPSAAKADTWQITQGPTSWRACTSVTGLDVCLSRGTGLNINIVNRTGAELAFDSFALSIDGKPQVMVLGFITEPDEPPGMAVGRSVTLMSRDPAFNDLIRNSGTMTVTARGMDGKGLAADIPLAGVKSLLELL